MSTEGAYCTSHDIVYPPAKGCPGCAEDASGSKVTILSSDVRPLPGPPPVTRDTPKHTITIGDDLVEWLCEHPTLTETFIGSMVLPEGVFDLFLTARKKP